MYLDLGLDKSNWARWSKENIEENLFFTQGVDFVQLATMVTPDIPRPPKEYAVSINMANHLAMMAKTERAHDYRNYFIELEKRFNDLSLKFLKLFEFEAKPAVTGTSLLYRRWLWWIHKCVQHNNTFANFKISVKTDFVSVINQLVTKLNFMKNHLFFILAKVLIGGN